VTVRWSSGARRDIVAIVDYLTDVDRVAATAMIDRIDDAVSLLDGHPALGRPGRVASTRELIIAGTPYIVVYRIVGPDAQVLRVLHAAQKWPATN